MQSYQIVITTWLVQEQGFCCAFRKKLLHTLGHAIVTNHIHFSYIWKYELKKFKSTRTWSCVVPDTMNATHTQQHSITPQNTWKFSSIALNISNFTTYILACSTISVYRQMINPLSTKLYLSQLKTHFVLHSKHFGFKNQSVNAVKRNNRSLFSDPHKTHKCIVGRTQNFWMLKLVLHKVSLRL